MKYLVFFILLITLGCTLEKDHVQKIEVSYIPGIFESPFSNCCDSAISTWNFKKYQVDTTIQDPLILRQMEDEIKKFKTSDTKFSVDGRIICTVYYSADSIISICLGQSIGTICDGRQVLDNQNFNYLLKKHSGYYYFIPYELVLKMSEIENYPERKLELMESATLYHNTDSLGIQDDSLINIQDIREMQIKNSKLQGE